MSIRTREVDLTQSLPTKFERGLRRAQTLIFIMFASQYLISGHYWIAGAFFVLGSLHAGFVGFRIEDSAADHPPVHLVAEFEGATVRTWHVSSQGKVVGSEEVIDLGKVWELRVFQNTLEFVDHSLTEGKQILDRRIFQSGDDLEKFVSLAQRRGIRVSRPDLAPENRR